MTKNLEDITLALAGIVQSAALVNQIAVTNTYDSAAFNSLIESILAQNPTSTLHVYGNTLTSVQLGLKLVAKLINERIEQDDRTISRYVISLMHLERKLAKSPDRLNNMGKRIQQINQQSQFFSHDPSVMLGQLAQIYLDNISTYRFRIHVVGNPSYISNQENLNKIRSLLLAGIRSTVLWRQLGGNRWHLFMTRKKIVETANHLVNC